MTRRRACSTRGRRLRRFWMTLSALPLGTHLTSSSGSTRWTSTDPDAPQSSRLVGGSRERRGWRDGRRVTMNKSRLWILGAPDPEMEAIENLLRECGEHVVYATDPVHVGDATDIYLV